MKRLLEDFIDNIDSNDIQVDDVKPEQNVSYAFEFVCYLNYPHIRNNMVRKDRANIEQYLEQNPCIDEFSVPEIYYGSDLGISFKLNCQFKKVLQILRFLYGFEKFGIYRIDANRTGNDVALKITQFSFMQAAVKGRMLDEKNKKNMQLTFFNDLHYILGVINFFCPANVKITKEFFDIALDDNVPYILNNWMTSVESVNHDDFIEVFIPVALRRKLRDSNIYYNELYGKANVILSSVVTPNIHKQIWEDSSLPEYVKNQLGTFELHQFKLFVDCRRRKDNWVYFVAYMGLVPWKNRVYDAAFSINGQLERYSNYDTFFDKLSKIFTNLYPDDIKALKEKIQTEVEKASL